LVGGVCTVQPRCRSASLPRSLGRSLICPPGPAAMLAWPPAFLMQGYDSAFRVWRILGGGKMRQTLCVFSLAKILYFFGGQFIPSAVEGKIFKRCLIFARSSPPIRQKNFIEEKQAAGKPNLSCMQRWLAIPHPPSSHSRAASALRASASPFMCLLPLKGMNLIIIMDSRIMLVNSNIH